ncbi:MAG: 4-hydroxythreonine-4-phosphate dehydrogenase PdxA [Alistipes sp.]|nr:4-hydroxythreonine-4-phosphate dehydrogenase PdxA [Alistipes senegalensis]MCM1249850.1 4-hydroxythreonine-4-phosphate dehydrogenase PdxA [Alistipes sp.]
MSEHRLKIGIAQGDPNGIGWEVILKALSDARMTELCTPVIYGSPKAADHYRRTIADLEETTFVPVAAAREARRGKVNIVACGDVEQIAPGKATPEAGRAAVEALRRAVEELKAGELDAIVTAPFDKESVQSDDFRYTGHTEYLGAELEGEPLMIMCSDILRIGLVTKHIPVSEISRSITREKIVKDLETMRRTLVADFGVVEPRIAVMALNPHAGDGGLLGTEEEEIIRPAIGEAYEKGILAFGPFAADGLFAGDAYTRYDGILAMYHDQGLAPFKSLSPDGVNFTAGLAAVRTSPDHGTAFDIAGRDKADAQSMRNAIYAAIDIVEKRRAHARWSADPLPRAERERDRNNRDTRDHAPRDMRARKESSGPECDFPAEKQRSKEEIS